MSAPSSPVPPCPTGSGNNNNNSTPSLPPRPAAPSPPSRFSISAALRSITVAAANAAVATIKTSWVRSAGTKTKSSQGIPAGHSSHAVPVDTGSTSPVAADDPVTDSAIAAFPALRPFSGDPADDRKDATVLCLGDGTTRVLRRKRVLGSGAFGCVLLVEELRGDGSWAKHSSVADHDRPQAAKSARAALGKGVQENDLNAWR